MSDLRYGLVGCDRVSLEMHLEAEIEWTQRCTLRGWSSEFEDAPAGNDQVKLEMHSEAVIECYGGVLDPNNQYNIYCI